MSTTTKPARRRAPMDEIAAIIERRRAAMSPMERFVFDLQCKVHADLLLYGHVSHMGFHATQTRDALIVTKPGQTCRHCGETVPVVSSEQ